MNWTCPYCGTYYDFSLFTNFDDMDECCKYYMGKEAFRNYRKKGGKK